MIFKSFLFTGIICLIAEVIRDNTKFTSGHITSLFVCLGSVLSFFNIYDKIIDYFGGGASVVIISFGNTLYKYGDEFGVLNMLGGASIGIVSSILVGVIITLIFRVKD